MADYKEIIQVEVFDKIPSNTKEDCNVFLSKIGTRCISCVSHYNSEYGCVVFVVTYHDVEKI